MLDSIVPWRKSKFGRITGIVISAVAAVGFGAWAVDSGSLWHWGLAFFFLFDAIISTANIFSTQKQKPHAKERRSKKAA